MCSDCDPTVSDDRNKPHLHAWIEVNEIGLEAWMGLWIIFQIV